MLPNILYQSWILFTQLHLELNDSCLSVLQSNIVPSVVLYLYTLLFYHERYLSLNIFLPFVFIGVVIDLLGSIVSYKESGMKSYLHANGVLKSSDYISFWLYRVCIQAPTINLMLTLFVSYSRNISLLQLM